MKKYILLLIVIFSLYSTSTAQYPPVEIPGSEVRKINSAIVNQEYELHILLPGGYSNTSKKYPVVYLMDSQWDFPLVKSIYGQQYYDGFIPEVIVVGVTWGGVKPNPDSLRVRDYTPTNDGRTVHAGRADQFLSFMKSELFPFIETNYRAGNDNRILMGCSLGGLFTLYTLFTQPELFVGYVAASPAIGWDKEVMYKYEKEFAQKKLPNTVRVYMTLGDVERSRPSYEKFAAKMTSSKYPSVSVRSKILENTGHSGTKSETYTRGLQYMFEKPKLDLSSTVLNKYAGVYGAGSANSIELKIENGKLVLYFSPHDKFVLYAASENEFYSTAELLGISFKMTGNKVEGFRLDRYGSSRFISKSE